MLKSPYILVALVCAAAAAYWISDFAVSEGRNVKPAQNSVYESSGQCRTCHPGRYESWRRTYHRTMTAPATPENMLAPIGPTPVQLKFFGYSVKFERSGNAYYAELPFLDRSYRRFPLLYTIGSRRMQQFAVQDGDRIYRLPVFYSIERRRWMHINEAFFHKKSQGLEAFLQGYSIWNPNCIFCHNTRPHPGYDPAQKSFRTSVAETGIACEECHAPGQTHMEVNHNPLRRYAYIYRGRRDPTIVHPEHLDKLRAVQVCGQCHGQRLPEPLDRINDIMANGDPYVPGTNLFEYYKPLAATDRLQNFDQFYLRFWKDGSPRLTAYELQGVLGSACFRQAASFTCISCHKAHGGDPRGMIVEDMRTDAACTQCHTQYITPEQVRAHTGHKDGSATCYSCHMPEIVYGVMTIHPTHLIRNPNPTSTILYDMPNACNLCHLDKSVNWAITATNKLWKKQYSTGDASYDQPEITRGILRGDAVYRTVLLYHARKQELREFESVYARALDDPFYVVSMFAADALAERYGKPWITAGEWQTFLAARGIFGIADQENPSLRRTPDGAFDFGE